MASGFALYVVGDSKDDFLDLPFLDTASQAFEIQKVGTDPSNWGKLAVQDMIATTISARTLDGEEIGHTLDDTHFPVFAFLVAANSTAFTLGQIPAESTGSHRYSRNPQSLDEVIEALVYLVITRENQGLPHTTDEAAQTALDELKDVYTQLMEKASERNEDALDMIRDRLSSTTDGLRESKNDDV